MSAGPIEEAVIAKIRARREVGLPKYGVGMERTDLSLAEWLIHAQQEILDYPLYLEQAIQHAAALEDKMREAWKLVDAIHGQEYWDRAEAWLKDNERFKPEGMA